mmetsp:Transcript_72406/g.204675  ORF Transcript_72406/g.204675 Transcript_72406/m.204675 type:complete len:264 (-) Transcript_72406:1759-2550(-)
MVFSSVRLPASESARTLMRQYRFQETFICVCRWSASTTSPILMSLDSVSTRERPRKRWGPLSQCFCTPSSSRAACFFRSSASSAQACAEDCVESRSASGTPWPPARPKLSLAKRSRISRQETSGFLKTWCTSVKAARWARSRLSWKVRALSSCCAARSIWAKTSPTTCSSGRSLRSWARNLVSRRSPPQVARMTPCSRSGSLLCAAFSMARRSIMRPCGSSSTCSRLSCSSTSTCEETRGSRSRSITARGLRLTSVATRATRA